MATKSSNNTFIKWLPFVFGAGLVISFFLSWVSWSGTSVSGYDMPGGNFFSHSKTKLDLENPFPQFAFSFSVFWLIPAGALSAMLLIALKKKWSLAAFFTGALSLSLVTVFFLVTRFAAGNEVFSMMRPGAWLQVFSAIGLILIAPASNALLKKIIWVAAGPVLVYISFMIIVKKMSEPFSDTAGVKADYTVTASDLIHEFAANDSVANKKYREKIVSVNGAASEVEIKSDSTINIKFADSTGSYINFSLEKNQYEKAKNIKMGDTVSLKGSCSGGIFSEILNSTAIDFKRSTLNKQ